MLEYCNAIKHKEFPQKPDNLKEKLTILSTSTMYCANIKNGAKMVFSRDWTQSKFQKLANKMKIFRANIMLK